MFEGKRVYIAGPMSGLNEWNAHAFERCEACLKRKGAADVFNPATKERIAAFERGEATRERLMLEDLQAVLDADAVVLLTDWNESFGAMCEVNVALQTGKAMYYFGEFTEFTEAFTPVDIDSKYFMRRVCR